MLMMNHRQCRGPLVSIHFDLDAQRNPGLGSGAPVDLRMQSDPSAHLKSKVLSKLRQSLSDRSNASFSAAHVVQIFAVAIGTLEVQLVQGGTTPEYQLAGEIRLVSYRTDCSGQQQILFDLFAGGPSVIDAPGRDRVRRDRTSGSTSRFR